MTALILLSVAAAFVAPESLGLFSPVIGILGYVSLTIIQRKPIAVDWSLGFILALIALLLTLSSKWSMATDVTPENALRLDLLILGSIPLLAITPHLLPSNVRRIIRVIPLLTSLTGLWLIAELYSGIPVTETLTKLVSSNETPFSIRTLETLFLVFLPFSLYAATKSGHLSIGTLLALLTGLILWKVDSGSIRLAGLCGLVAPLILFLFPKSGISAPVLLTGFILAFMPFMAPLLFDAYKETATQPLEGSSPATAIGKNLEMYDFVARKIIENPMTGFGIGSSGFLHYETEQKFYKGASVEFPHNMMLQIWLEFGIIGVVIFGGLLLSLYNRLNRTHGMQRTLAYSTFCIGLMIMMFAWSIWSEWLISAIILTACLLPLAREQPRVPVTS